MSYFNEITNKSYHKTWTLMSKAERTHLGRWAWGRTRCGRWRWERTRCGRWALARTRCGRWGWARTRCVCWACGCACPWRRAPRRSWCPAPCSSCPWSWPWRSSPAACCSGSPCASWPVSLTRGGWRGEGGNSEGRNKVNGEKDALNCVWHDASAMRQELRIDKLKVLAGSWPH